MYIRDDIFGKLEFMDKPENSTLLNVCIIPNERVSAAFATMSQSLKSDHTMFTLGEGLFAHMTVYMARFANNNVQYVVNAVGKALESASSFHCEHTGYFMTEGRYLEASYRKSSAFMQFHELMITHNKDLRINPGRPFNEGYFAPYTEQQQQNAQETGYDLARNLYRPHVTLTRYAEGDVPEVFPALPAANLSFDIEKVCVYKADDNGAVYELVHEFWLS